MRLTVRHLLWAAALAGLGLSAFAAMRVADHLIGHASSSTPGIVSAIFMAVWIFLVRQYGPRGPVDPRRQRIWLLSSLAAAAGAMPVFWLIAAGWIRGPYQEPQCPPRLWTNPVPLDNGVKRGVAFSRADEGKIVCVMQRR
jgi:hypothetical protein